MRRFQNLTCPALILGALLFAAGAGAAEESGGKKAEEPKTEREPRSADEPDGKKAEERKAEPERPSVDKPDGRKVKESKTEPKRPSVDKPDGKKAEEPKAEPERRSVDKPDGKKTGERKTEPKRAEADKPAKKTSGPLRTSFNFKNMPMTKVVFEIQRLSGLNIVLHPDLAKANPTITLRVKNMPLGSALDWVCHLADARYVLVDEAIYIVPKSRARRKR
ncbi:MAG: STN domain-containing protein [Planctomycetota bacterium]|jgi:outer membrane biosynthesis protein TonB